MKTDMLFFVLAIFFITMSCGPTRDCAFKEEEHNYKKGAFGITHWDYASEHKTQFIGLGSKCIQTLFGMPEEKSGIAPNHTLYYYAYEGNKRVGETIVKFKMGKVADITSNPL